mgnify:CR=1 FL=1
MKYSIQVEKEVDGRWIAEISDLPGVLAYGATKDEVIAKAEALALRVVAEKIEHGETGSDFTISFSTL